MGTYRKPRIARARIYLQLVRDTAGRGHLPVARQLLEMCLLFAIRGLGPGYYLLGRFWRRDLRLRDKLRHLGNRAYARNIVRLNHPDYRKLSQHKVAEKAMLSLLSIPTPGFLGHLHPLGGRTGRAAPLRDGEDLSRLLERERPDRIFIKPVEGWEGIGARAIEPTYGSRPTALRDLAAGTEISPDELVTELRQGDPSGDGYIVEEFVRQHAWYRALNPTSVNTLRVCARRSPGKPTQILGGCLRIGRAGSIVDNLHSGGVYCRFDPVHGVLAAGRVIGVDAPDYPTHPETGAQLEGCRLPAWPAVRELVSIVMDVFPHLGFAGLDIAVTENGPTVIEINPQPGHALACVLDIPTLDLLKGDSNL